MRRVLLLLLLVGFARAAGAVPAGYELVLADDFDGTALDASIWSQRLPGPRRDAVNVPEAVQVGGGHLTIDTWTEGGVHYTGMIGTQGLFEQRYGWWEARIEFDDMPGMWSAFWLQSPDMGQFIGDPERAGVEMDIVEFDLFTTVGSEPIWNGGLHWDGYGADHQFVVQPTSMPALAEGFHTFALEWTPTVLRFYVDDALVWDASDQPISQRAQYMILSSEVESSLINTVPSGGFGAREESAARMTVDWVRVYRAVPEPSLVWLLVLAVAAVPRERRRA